MVTSLSAESAPASCPSWAPAGTFPAGTNVKSLCERAVSRAPSREAAAAIRYMFSMLGSAYNQSNRYSTNPPVFDCSSFVSRAYTAAGARITNGSSQWTWISRFGWTGAYMPSAYEGTNLTRMAFRPGDISGLVPGDVLIQFSGSNPAGSVGNNGHAQVYIGDGMVIQSGGNHPRSLVNVTAYTKPGYFNNEWYFRYQSSLSGDPIYDKWMQLGGASGLAGQPVSQTEPNSRGGLTRRYERGHIYWSRETGAAFVTGAVLATYGSHGYDRSALGLPTSDETDRGAPGSRGNNFQYGVILWSLPTGAHSVYGAVGAKYISMGAERSPLGLPTSEEMDGPLPNSRGNVFQGGTILWSAATGAHSLYGAIGARYNNHPHVRAAVGLPISSEVPSKVPGVPVQTFQRGAMYWSPEAGPVEIHGGIFGAYQQLGQDGSPLGFPTSVERDGDIAGSRVQDFSGGRIIWAGPTGAHALWGAIGARYNIPSVRASLGLPLSSEVPSRVAGSPVQRFERGLMYWSPSYGPVEVIGGIAAAYRSLGAEGSALGIPVAVERNGATRGSRVQDFTGGQILWSGPTGAHAVYGQIAQRYRSAGGEAGLGLPVSGVLSSGAVQYQKFQRGLISSTGGQAYVVSQDVGNRYISLGSDRSALGLPTGPLTASARDGVAYQPFVGGRIYRSTYGAWEVYGGIWDTYRRIGAEKTILGPPTSGEIAGPVPGSRMNIFAGGAIIWGESTGAHAVQGTMWQRYSVGRLAPVIGLPRSTSSNAGVPGAAMQEFERGTMYWSAATGAHHVTGAIGREYQRIGAAKSRLGLPTGQEYSIATGRAQKFQGGQITWTARTGKIEVRYR